MTAGSRRGATCRNWRRSPVSGPTRPLHFDGAADEVGLHLDLGNVLATAGVVINGQQLPTTNLMDVTSIDLGPYLRDGHNELTVTVSSLLGNAVAEQGVGAYGLLGPVELRPYIDLPVVEDDPGEPEPPVSGVCENVSSVPSFRDARVNFHGEAIACLEAYGLAFGSANGEFRPRANVSRDQMASFVQRLLVAAGAQLPGSPPDRFADDDGSVHEVAIDQLAAVGVVEGKTDGRYAPRDPVTRAQMASLLVRAVEYVTGESLPAPSSPFVDIGAPHARAIDAAFAAGITVGKTATTFDPQSDLARDQMASLLVGTLQVLADAGLVDPLD